MRFITAFSAYFTIGNNLVGFVNVLSKAHYVLVFRHSVAKILGTLPFVIAQNIGLPFPSKTPFPRAMLLILMLVLI